MDLSRFEVSLTLPCEGGNYRVCFMEIGRVFECIENDVFGKPFDVVAFNKVDPCTPGVDAYFLVSFEISPNTSEHINKYFVTDGEHLYSAKTKHSFDAYWALQKTDIPETPLTMKMIAHTIMAFIDDNSWIHEYFFTDDGVGTFDARDLFNISQNPL